MSVNVWAVVGGVAGFLPMSALTGTAGQLLGMDAGATLAEWKNVKVLNDQLLLTDGSDTVPSLAWGSDTDLGIYRIGANTFGFSFGAGNRVTWSNTKLVLGVAGSGTNFHHEMMEGYIKENMGDPVAIGGTSINAGASTGNFFLATNSTGTRNVANLAATTSLQAGTEVVIQFSISGGTVNLIHSDPGLYLLGEADINAVKNGDVAVFRKTSDVASEWRMTHFSRGLWAFNAPGELIFGASAYPHTKLLTPTFNGDEGKRLMFVGSAGSDPIAWVEPPPDVVNYATNPFFYINQAAPATNADDTYAHDGWIALTQANPIAITTITDVEDGMPSAARLTQANVAAQRMGYLMILEAKESKKLRGKQVWYGGKFRCSSSAPDLRIALLEWTGAEDAVTSDVVNNWASATYTPGNFFIGANLAVASSNGVALVANITQEFKHVGVISSLCNNLMLFFWTENTAAQNVTFDISRVRLQLYDGLPFTGFGASTTTIAEPYFETAEQSLARAQRFYQKSFALGTTPAQNVGLNTGEFTNFQAVGAAAATHLGRVLFPTRMRATPTVTTFNPQAANAFVRNQTVGADAGATTVVNASDAGFSIDYTTAAGSAAGNRNGVHWTADARL